MRKCEKCGSVLIPGENWYTMKPDYVCCFCSKFPEYHNVPSQKRENDTDYEALILARQETD